MVEIQPSARKHGVGDADVRHATEHALVVADSDEDPDKVLYLGPDRAGNFLEVIAIARDDKVDLVIHAMRMRSSYRPLLRGPGEADD